MFEEIGVDTRATETNQDTDHQREPALERFGVRLLQRVKDLRVDSIGKLRPEILERISQQELSFPGSGEEHLVGT